MLPDVGMVQMYSKSANVNDLGFAWTGCWAPLFACTGPPLCLQQRIAVAVQRENTAAVMGHGSIQIYKLLLLFNYALGVNSAQTQ